MQDPVVSVVMSVYKDRGQLRKTIESVLLQTFADFEFIIIDDSPDDYHIINFKKVTQEDSRVRIIANSKNIGLTKSLHKGVKEAQGIYIARIDEGDIWNSKKLEKQVEFLEENSEYVIVGSQYNTYSNSKNAHSSTQLPRNNNEIRNWLKKGWTPFTHPAILFRNIGINYNLEATTSQDFELYIRLYFLGNLKNLEEQLVSIQIEANSISSDKEQVQFYNHMVMHHQFLKLLKSGIPHDDFVKTGVQFENALYFMNFRKKYMRWVLNLVRFIGQKSIIGKAVKNILVPDVLIYNLKRKVLF